VPTNVCSWWKSGDAVDITTKTDFDPAAVIGLIEILHRSRLLLHGCVALLGAEPLGYRARAARVPFRLVPDG